MMIAQAAPTNASTRAFTPESRTSCTKNFMRYPPRHNNVAPLEDSLLTPLNTIHQVPNLGCRMGNLDFLAGPQTLVCNRMNGIIERGKENTIPTSILPFSDLEVRNKSSRLSFINSQHIYDKPEFIAAQSLNKIYQNGLHMSKAQDILWPDGERSYHTKKDAQASLPWFNPLHKDENPGIARRQIYSYLIKLSPRKRQRFDLHRRIKSKDKFKARSLLNIRKTLTAMTTEEMSPKLIEVTMNEFSLDGLKPSLPMDARNNFQAQAPIVLQPKKPQREPWVVFRRSIESYKYFRSDEEKRNHCRAQNLLPKMLPPVQITTNVPRQLIQDQSLVFPTSGKTNSKQQSHSDVEICSRPLSNNCVIPIPYNLYKPIHGPDVGELNQPKNLSSVPELYLRIPNSTIFVPTPKFKPCDSEGQFKLTLALYTLPNQFFSFYEKPKLSFTAYIEVTPPTIEAVMSSNGRFFQVAGYLVLHFQTLTPLTKKRQFLKLAALEDGLDYDLLSIRPRIGEMAAPIAQGPVPQVLSRQPNPLFCQSTNK